MQPWGRIVLFQHIVESEAAYVVQSLLFLLPEARYDNAVMSDTAQPEFHVPTSVAAVKGAGVYDAQTTAQMVRDALNRLQLPADFVRPGDRVVLKPNWIKQHDERHPGPDHWEQVITHPAVIEAVTRWAAEKLNGQGSVALCDAPQTDSSFETIRAYCGLDEMVERLRNEFPGVAFSLLDLRPEEWKSVDGVTISKRALPGDPCGNTRVSLNEASEFVGFHGEGKLYGASFDMDETNRHHSDAVHEYMLCRTPLDADVLINIPKLKTHKKVGVTCALKNLVGINADKNWLPHHTEGTPDDGGDQFPAATAKAKMEHRWMGAAKRRFKGKHALSRILVPLKKIGRLFFGDTQHVVRSGNWHGNDTCWRMVLDLNKCLFHFGGDGQPRARPLRYLAVVDGIVGGEGNGPMAPDPVACGVILAGTHPAAVDTVAAAIMGFDPRKIRLLNGAFAMKKLNYTSFAMEDIRVDSNYETWHGTLDEMSDTFSFRPHFGWTGAIEKHVPHATRHVHEP